MLKGLYSHRLVFVTGKGGVGKSTMTAALGLHCAKSGRKTLVCETDTFSAMRPLLGIETAVDHEPTQAAPNLWACNIKSERALAQLVQHFVPSERLARAAVGNRLARLFFRTAPSIYELSVLHRIKSLMDQEEGGRPKYDTIIVDLPATGHAITFLGVPEAAQKVLRVGGVAEMSGQLAAALRDPAITDLVIVSLPEEMPVNESIELHAAAKEKLGLTSQVVVINMVRPSPVGDDKAAALAALSAQESVPEIGHLIRGAQLGHGWSVQDRKYIEKLRGGIEGAQFIEIPYVFDPESDVDLVGRIAEQLP